MDPLFDRIDLLLQTGLLHLQPFLPLHHCDHLFAHLGVLFRASSLFPRLFFLAFSQLRLSSFKLIRSTSLQALLILLVIFCLFLLWPIFFLGLLALVISRVDLRGLVLPIFILFREIFKDEIHRIIFS